MRRGTHLALALSVLAGCASCTDASGHAAQPARAPEPPDAATPPHVLVPKDAGPLAPGAARTTAEGCLATRTESEGSKFPVTRATPAPQVTVAPAAGGVVVSHALRHACCLRADVATRIDDRTLVVTEKLSGTPCRCLCSSTLRTEVGLAPGSWTIAVDLDEGRGAERVYSGTHAVGGE